MFHNSGFLGGTVFAGMRSRFLCFIAYFWAKNAKKCKKMQKNEKKLQKNLHISKICCNFAPSFKNKGRQNTKK